MKTAIFIPVRLSSSRLPGKALKTINNKPCFQLLVDRVKRTKNIDLIVLCTTKNPVDDKLVKLAEKLNIFWFRGSEIDVLKRYLDASKKLGVDYIVNVDGDDIFCEPELIDLTVKILQTKNYDFVVWKNLPLGVSPVGLKVDALKKICKLKNTENTETGWGKFFTETGLFQVKYLDPPRSELKNQNIRLTLDYPEDFELFKKIYENLKEPFSLKDIIQLFRKKPSLMKINENVKEIYWKNFSNKSTEVKMKKEKKYLVNNKK